MSKKVLTRPKDIAAGASDLDIYPYCKANGWKIDTDNKMKTVPKIFPKDAINAEYLKLKDFILNKKIDDAYVLSDNLLERVTEEFAKTYEFKEFVNRAISAID